MYASNAFGCPVRARSAYPGASVRRTSVTASGADGNERTTPEAASARPLRLG